MAFMVPPLGGGVESLGACFGDSCGLLERVGACFKGFGWYRKPANNVELVRITSTRRWHISSPLERSWFGNRES